MYCEVLRRTQAATLPSLVAKGWTIALGITLTCLATSASAEANKLDLDAAYCAQYWQMEKKVTSEDIDNLPPTTPKNLRDAMRDSNAGWMEYLKSYAKYRATRVAAIEDSALSSARQNAESDFTLSSQDIARCVKDNAGNNKAVGPCVMRSEAGQRLKVCSDAFVKRLSSATPLSANATVTLSAAPGEFNFQLVGTPAKQSLVTASIQLTQLNPSDSWPPAAYLGFFEGEDRNNSAQFVIIRNNKDDTFLVTGYRIVENGAEVKSAGLASLPLDGQATVTMSIDNGLVTLSSPPRVLASFQTNLGEVTPYISVSSGTAKFSISHGN